MLYSYGYCYFPQRRRAAETCGNLKCEEGTQGAGLMHVMHVVARSAKKGRCDAEDAADEIRRENGEKTTQLYLNSLFFILHLL